MTKEMLARFGNICADSLVFQSLSDTFVLSNRISDIERLFLKGRSAVGNIIGNTSKVIVYLKKRNGYTVLKASAGGIVVWMSQSSESVEDLAWTYIDLLSGLKASINNARLFNYGDF